MENSLPHTSSSDRQTGSWPWTRTASDIRMIRVDSVSQEDGSVTIWGPGRGRSPLPGPRTLDPGPSAPRTPSPRRLDLGPGPVLPAMVIEPPTPPVRRTEDKPKLRKRVIKKKDDIKKLEEKREGEEFLRCKAVEENVEVGEVTAEKEATTEVETAPEEEVMAKELLTAKERKVMAAVLSSRRSRSRSSSRMEGASPLPAPDSPSPIPVDEERALPAPQPSPLQAASKPQRIIELPPRMLHAESKSTIQEDSVVRRDNLSQEEEGGLKGEIVVPEKVKEVHVERGQKKLGQLDQPKTSLKENGESVRAKQPTEKNIEVTCEQLNEQHDDIVEEIMGSVQDVRQILDRLSKDAELDADAEEPEELSAAENPPKSSLSVSDNTSEKSKECFSAKLCKKEKVDEREPAAPFLIEAVDSIADLDFEQVRQHLLAEEEVTASLRRKMEEVREGSSPALGGGRGAAQPTDLPVVRPENPASAKVRSKVDPQKGTTCQNALVKTEMPDLAKPKQNNLSQEVPKQKALQSNGMHQHNETNRRLRNSSNEHKPAISQGQRTPNIIVPEPPRHNTEIHIKGNEDQGQSNKENKSKSNGQTQLSNGAQEEAAGASWRQGRGQVEVKGPGSKKKQQEAKVQEFLRGPGAPEGPPVPLEVRLRKPGVEREEEVVTEVGSGLLIAPHSLLSRPDLHSLLSSHSASVLEVSTSASLPTGPHYTHIGLGEAGPDFTTFTAVADQAARGRQLLVCSEGLGAAALLSAAALSRAQGIKVGKALDLVLGARRVTVPAGLRLRLEEWGCPPSASPLQAVVSWLPLLVALLLLGLLWRRLTTILEEEHRSEALLTPYSYFNILKWP